MVFWLQRPPYLRWAAMGALVVFAVWIDLRGGGSEERPFAAADLAPGATLSEENVEWREVQRGLLPKANLDGKVAAHAIERGDPITPSSTADYRLPPDDWWSVELPLPDGATAGQAARVVVEDPPISMDAVIVSIAESGAFANSDRGLVAVPADHADTVARAAARGAAIVLVAP